MRAPTILKAKKAGLSGLFLLCALVFVATWPPSIARAEPLRLAVQRAMPALDSQTNEPLVRFTFTPESKQAFADFTAQNIGKTIELRVDGRVLMRPVIQQPIYGGTGSIAGGFTFPQAAEMAERLTAGTAILEVEVVGE